MEKSTLILGGTGKTGSRIASRLLKQDWPIRIGSRAATPAFDWNNPSTWVPVLKDMDSVYITFQPDLAVPGAVETIRRFAETAVFNGVKKMVLLSGRGEPEAQNCEQIVMNAGVEWTILRSSWFDQNFSEDYLLDPLLAGHVALPAGNVGEPFIDADDIADVAVAALTKEGHSGEIYELTGPRLLTFGEAVQTIAKHLDRPIQYQEITIEEYAAMLLEYEIPGEYVALVKYLFTEVLDGRNEKLGDGVQRALGHKPTDFDEFVRKTVPTGAWNVPVI